MCTKNWVHSQATFMKRFLFGPCDSKVRSQEPLLFSVLLVLFLPALWAIVVVKYILAVVSRRVLCPDVMLLHFGLRLSVSLLLTGGNPESLHPCPTCVGKTSPAAWAEPQPARHMGQQAQGSAVQRGGLGRRSA